jgi:uncharacterized protein (DUF58 family)
MNRNEIYNRLYRFIFPTPDGLSPWGRRLMFMWRHRVTPAGRMLLIILLIAGPVSASITLNRPLYFYSILLFSLMLVGRLFGILFAPRVKISRALPERCAAGATVTIEAKLENIGLLPIFDLAASERFPGASVRLSENPVYHPCLRRGESATLPYTLEFTRRGVCDFTGPVALTVFPFGVYHHAKMFSAPHRMLVYPRFAPLTDIALPVGRKHQPGGLQMASHVGDSEEFLGNREYRPGDRLRDIHHAAWARTGFPVVREFQQEYLCRIALIVDTHAPKKSRRELADLEAALSLSASIADVLSRREYLIDIFAAGPDLYHFQAGRSLAHLDNILDILACIDACVTDPFATLGPALREEIKNISTAVIILLDWSEEKEEFVRFVQSFGVMPKVLVVRDTPPTLEPGGVRYGGEEVKIFAPAEIQRGLQTV